MAPRVTRRHVDSVTAAHGEVQEAWQGVVSTHTASSSCPVISRTESVDTSVLTCSHLRARPGEPDGRGGRVLDPVQLHAGTEARPPGARGLLKRCQQNRDRGCLAGAGGEVLASTGGRRPATSSGIESPAAVNGEPNSVAH